MTLDTGMQGILHISQNIQFYPIVKGKSFKNSEVVIHVVSLRNVLEKGVNFDLY